MQLLSKDTVESIAAGIYFTKEGCFLKGKVIFFKKIILVDSKGKEQKLEYQKMSKESHKFVNTANQIISANSTTKTTTGMSFLINTLLTVLFFILIVGFILLYYFCYFRRNRQNNFSPNTDITKSNVLETASNTFFWSEAETQTLLL